MATLRADRGRGGDYRPGRGLAPTSPAGAKGQGAFAAEAAAAGQWLFDYEGEVLSAEQQAARYLSARAPAEYVHRSGFDGLVVDAACSTHPSRYVNHAAAGSAACNYFLAREPRRRSLPKWPRVGKRPCHIDENT